MTATLTRPATALMDQEQIEDALTLVYEGTWEGPKGSTVEDFEKCITAEFLAEQRNYVEWLSGDDEEHEEPRIEAAEQLTTIKVIQAAHAQGKKIYVTHFKAWSEGGTPDDYSYEFAIAVTVAVV